MVTYDDIGGTARTVVTYDSVGRVHTVTLPAPALGAARPMHTYDYDTAEARVIVEGLTPASGFARRVGLDAQGRLLTDTDATDQTTTYAYDTGNRVVSVIDPAGRMSTAVHDDGVTRSHPSGRRSHSYGPALEDCFTGLVPDNTCTDPPPPHTATTYDTEVVTGTALTGLAAAYWEDRALLGLPKNHGPADPASLTSVDPPAAGLGAGAWSASIRTTADIYGSLPEKVDRGVADQLDGLFASACGADVVQSQGDGRQAPRHSL